MTWKEALHDIKEQETFKTLLKQITHEYNNHTVYPPIHDLFKVFEVTDFDNVKIVILGQDPYHGPAQANGLAFSVNRDVKIPPSLKNIYKEMHDDLNVPIPEHGDLTNLAKEGVMLLNTTMSVQEGKPGSHRHIDWDWFTGEVIKKLSEDKKPKVFLLWGRHAQGKAMLIDENTHLTLKAPHPSPLSAYRGFFGCRHFSKANRFLKENGRPPVSFKV